MKKIQRKLEKHPVFILSLFDTGYYAARSLRKAGITIYGFDHKLSNPGFFSKYIKAFETPHPIKYPEKLLEVLLSKQSEFNLKPVLIAASEIYLEFILNQLTILEKYFLFVLPSMGILKSIINKSEQFILASNAGINVPEYKIIQNPNDLYRVTENIMFPVILKGSNQIEWKNCIKEKAYIAENYYELKTIARELFYKRLSFIVQKFIPGKITDNFEYNALMINGRIVKQHVVQKINQFPLNTGSACCVKTVENKEVQCLGARFIIKNRIEGFSNTEFKFDPSTGKYFFIETNARVWQQIELSDRFDDNFLLLYYKILTDDKALFVDKASPRGLIWIDFPTYFLLILKYKKNSNLGYLEFIKTTCMAKNYGLFNLFDLKPFLKELRLIIK